MNHWKEYVDKVDDKSIFQIKKYIINISISTFISTLNNHAATNEQKVNAFRKAFFPKSSSADLTNIPSTSHSQEISYEAQITTRQIREAINRLAPDKAFDSDEILNRVLKNTIPTIEHHLQALMQVSLRTKHFFKSFKQTIIVVLRKPNKSDYIKVKAYRPIALENTIGKVMESIIAEIISYLIEIHELLPPHHYGGRPDRSTEDAMMIMSKNIYKAWKEKKIYTAIFMDVAGAFNNVHHERLIHNLRKRRIPHVISL